MKIALASDIHLEFGDLMLKNEQDADLLILAGDICVAKDALKEGDMGDRVRNFFQRVSFQFPQTLYVMGNHEHYSGDFAKSQNILQTMLDQLCITNIKIMEKSIHEIGNVTFIGGTMWTDFNNGDSITLFHAAQAMNDYRGVRNSNSGHASGVWKFLPKHSYEDHVRMKQYIRMILGNLRDQGRTDQRVVVISHHAPTHLSIDEYYKNDAVMNGNFASRLDDLILDHPEIAVWVHGHMHNPSDYQVGDTRVLCNPRGYIGYESRANTFELLHFEV